MIPYARLRPGQGFEPARAAMYYAQRLVTEPTLRHGISDVLAAGVRTRHGTAGLSGDAANAAGILSQLRMMGLARLDDLFPTDELAAIVAYFHDQPVIGGDGREVPLRELSPGTAIAAYSLQSVVDCPGLMQGLNRPDLLQMIATYLRCVPTLCSLGVRWSFPSARTVDATQHFHRDPDDWRFVKLFVYLTDVDAGAGPHIYVAGSNRGRGNLRARPYARSALEARYGKENMWTILGRRGTTFLADTYGIHAGTPPARTPRLLLQAQYSILPNYSLQYKPVQYSRPGRLDQYINRLILAQVPGGQARSNRVDAGR